MKNVKSLTRSFFMLTGAFILLLVLSPTTQPLNSQIQLCDIAGIKEEGTGIVYCIGLGSSTCVVPCSDDGGGKEPPVLGF
ncbi:MAG: hypothetical protein KatS3mg033_0180 [Thermonema sp.]|uniref:hypothetical protein n=1 Tax=Thermonema sp. TaxID=2231181 RepID=UPI0021DCBCC2|nr:hypothetical protein [Thermonema sp.]GIV38380.1 MAG: hypothetical protein KatS3mg033_0180 [Thermonema sp.]